MRRVVDGCYLLAAGALAPIVVYRACRTGKYRTDWRERRGFLPDMDARIREERLARWRVALAAV